MKWVIIGSAGQLGAELLDLMTDSAVGLPRDMGDLTNPLQLERNLLAEKPDGVINCAAFNHVDKAEDSPDEAFANNSWGVKDLAIICDKYNWKFVQFSTDHVFSGSKSVPWVETDLAVPANAYGLSKYSGEMWAQKMNTNTYNIKQIETIDENLEIREEIAQKYEVALRGTKIRIPKDSNNICICKTTSRFLYENLYKFFSLL